MSLTEIVSTCAFVAFFAALSIWGVVESYRLSAPIRFSLRALLIAMTGIAVVVGLFSAMYWALK
jgi:hypothetical protein